VGRLRVRRDRPRGARTRGGGDRGRHGGLGFLPGGRLLREQPDRTPVRRPSRRVAVWRHRRETRGLLVTQVKTAGPSRYVAWIWGGWGPRMRRFGRWTGFHEKSLLDYIQIIVLPFVLIAGGQLVSQAVNASARAQALEDAQEQRLQEYLNQMASLALDRALLDTEVLPAGGVIIREVARAQTLTALAGMDGPRKRFVVTFLYELGLVNGNEPLILMNTSDLSEADLVGAELFAVNLSGARLADAALDGARLTSAMMNRAELNHASLRRALLVDTRLNQADLRLADLTGIDASNASMFAADLRGADLTDANLA